MSGVIETVRPLLLADSAVAAIVAARIYPLTVPQGSATPYVVLTTVSDAPVNSFSGSADSRLRFARLQVDTYAASTATEDGLALAHDVDDAINLVLANLLSSYLAGQRENSEELFDDATGYYRVSSDYWISL